MYRVLLYYQYVPIEDPEAFAADHKQLCQELELKGRILVAHEGINGTVSGTVEQTNRYIDHMQADERFKDMVFKVDEAEGHAFAKLKVRPRKELVTLRLEDDINPLEVTGDYLEPKAFLEAMKEENTVILDARNTYEHELGHFKGAIRPEVETFRELPQWIQDHRSELEGKKILTYCTGGIRCEKFSGFLKQEGFDDVGQLHGGIVSYGKDPDVQGENWDGQCFVFDDRLRVPVNKVNPLVVGRDLFTGEPCERHVSCGNPECNKKILMSEETEHAYLRACSDHCRTHPRNRYVSENGLTAEDVQERLDALLQNV